MCLLPFVYPRILDDLGQGWDSSAVGKALVSVEAHTDLAHSLADGSCAVAIQVKTVCRESILTIFYTRSIVDDRCR